MTIISMIAAVDEQRGLGKDNKLLCHLPADLKHFKELTLGKPIIMGRKTYESIGRALPGRLNIVLSKHAKPIIDITLAHSLDEALEITKDSPEVMVIGGANLFAQALPLAHRVYLTIIRAQFDADVFFPELDKNAWQCMEVIDRPHDEKNPYDLSFCRYDLNS
jgi:dihydrofolate reductase